MLLGVLPFGRLLAGKQTLDYAYKAFLIALTLFSFSHYIRQNKLECLFLARTFGLVTYFQVRQ
jgi:hypothetical protein